MDQFVRRGLAVQSENIGRIDFDGASKGGAKLMSTADVTISDCTLKITHLLDTPRATAFQWWASAEQLQRWSGCEAATKCDVRMDFRVGGSFEQTMQIVGRGEFTFRGVYDEIIVPERIRYHAKIGVTVVRVSVEFFDQDEQTKIVITQQGFPDERAVKTVSQGTLESLSALDAILTA
jgi:uncharacterized protein YndB with AHSA1/START domain